MPTKYAATLQVRTTLDQAGQIAGLSGELEVSEAEVTRRLLRWSLETPGVLKKLRSELGAEREAEPTEAEIDAAIARQEARR